MVITLLLNLIFAVLSFLLVFNLPSLPDSVLTIASNATDYIASGVSMFRVFVGDTCMGVIGVLLTLVLAMNAAYLVYSLVFWVIRKVPMLNVKE